MRVYLRRDPVDRFMAKVEPEPNSGCWLWLGALNGKGYGVFERFGVGRRRANTAHRFSYEVHRGPIPEGLDLDHLCRVHQCVNPSHLEAVPRRVNLLRGAGFNAINAAKTHCRLGHPFSGDNLVIVINTYGTERRCRECRNRVARAYHWRVRVRQAF